MKETFLRVLVVASVLSPAVFAQTAKPKPTTATYITKEEIDLLSNSEQKKAVDDENTKIIDLGPENFTVGVIHRASTRNTASTAPAAPAANAGAPATPAETCGRTMATLPPGGTVFTDGYIVNGRHSAQPGPGGPNGPTCGGMAYEVKKVVVKPGDVIIVPPGVVHGWSDIPDHVDYLSFRPSENVLTPGWVNPTIQK